MIKKIIFIALVIFIGLFIVFKLIDKPMPQGEQNEKAEQLAKKMLEAVHHQNWKDSTGVVVWNFGDRQQHVWDKQRHYAKVSWKEYEVLFDIDRRIGKAFKDGEEVLSEKRRAKLIDKAWKFWANDSYWLNPISKIYDDGTIREEVILENGESALLVTYMEGGVTPGDSYLWILDDTFLPTSWQLWVKIIPFGGFETSWDDWIETETGAKISTLHRSKIFDLQIKDIKTAKSYDELFPEDEFSFLENY